MGGVWVVMGQAGGSLLSGTGREFTAVCGRPSKSSPQLTGGAGGGCCYGQLALPRGQCG